MELETPRLRIREFTLDDLPDVHAYGGRADTVRFMEWGPNTEAQSLEFLQRKLARQTDDPRREFEMAAVLKKTGRVIGGIGLRITRPEHREGDIGYVFHPDVWGRGFCTEAAGVMVRFGFTTLGLHRIHATCDPENRASARVMEKVGMRFEGRMRGHLYQKGAWRDSLLYAMLEDEGTTAKT